MKSNETRSNRALLFLSQFVVFYPFSVVNATAAADVGNQLETSSPLTARSVSYYANGVRSCLPENNLSGTTTATMYAAVRRSWGSPRTLGGAGLLRRCHDRRCDGGGGDDGRPPLRVTLIEGQGPGPTVCAAVRKVVQAAGARAHWDRRSLNEHRDPRTGRPAVNADVLRSAVDTGLVLRGPGAGSAQDGSHGSAALTLHKALGASVGVKLFASVDGHHPFGRVRIVNVRDNVSGEYSEIEHTVVPGK